MNVHELEQRLAAEGCNSNLYAIGSRAGASDAFCLVRDGIEWQIFYTERGFDQPPFYRSCSESEACEYFFNYIISLQHDHCVGFFASESSCQQLVARLEQGGIQTHQDRIPCMEGWRYRVFVTGKDIFTAQAILINLPSSD